ncbi:MAG: hypothetical protein ACJAT4_001968 [Granulosicoccus sp.]|jgi:hypothetical protein
MNKRFIPLFTLVFLIANFMSAQTTEEMQTMLDEKKAAVAAKAAEVKVLEGEIADIKKKLIIYPDWKIGASGTIGANFSQFDKWLGAGNPNAQLSNYGLTGAVFANLNQKKYFWRNGLNLNVAKTKLIIDKDDKDLADTTSFETTADAINLTSLFGYKLNGQWAISALGEYRSTLLNNFNNPGYLDLGVGATWTPLQNLVGVFHPLNYNIVMAQDDVSYKSSLGCKIVVDYNQALPMGIAWRSNISGFVSYSDPNNFSNWTWVNGINFTAWKGIGVGFEFGLRKNKQESYNTFLVDPTIVNPETITIDTFDDDTNKGDNPLQTYLLLGLTYTISR